MCIKIVILGEETVLDSDSIISIGYTIILSFYSTGVFGVETILLGENTVLWEDTLPLGVVTVFEEETVFLKTFFLEILTYFKLSEKMSEKNSLFESKMI